MRKLIGISIYLVLFSFKVSAKECADVTSGRWIHGLEDTYISSDGTCTFANITKNPINQSNIPFATATGFGSKTSNDIIDGGFDVTIKPGIVISGGPEISILRYDADGNGSVSGTEFATAISAIGSTQTTLVYDASTTVSATVSTPATLASRFVSPGKLIINTGVTLTVNGPWEAPFYKVIDLTGTGAVSFGTTTTPISYLTPRWWGATGDGTTQDTTAIQDCFDAAYTPKIPVYFPSGVYLTGTISYRGQSMYGDPGQVLFLNSPSTIQGLDSKDVFQFVDCTAATTDYIDGTVIKDLKIIVDDTTDASALFPLRHGAGNAGFALPNEDGDDTGHAFGSIHFFNGGMYRVSIQSLSATTNPSNNSVGIYAQANIYNFIFEQVHIGRLSYGYWEDQPGSDVTSTEYAPDANQFINVVFSQCTNAFRSYNSVHSIINGMQVYATISGQKSIQLLQFTSKTRAETALWTINNLFVEGNAATTGTLMQIQGRIHSFIGSTLKQSYGDAVIDWDANSCTVIGCQINGATSGSAILQIDGSNNKFLQISTRSITNNWIDNNGNGNHVEVVSFDSVAEVLSKPVVQTISRMLPAQNRTIDFIKNNASLPFHNIDDLWLWPSGISWTGQTPTITKEATLESGEYVTLPSPGGGFFSIAENETMVIGGRAPASRVRIYIKAQMASSGTNQAWSVTVNAVSKGSKVLAFTTSYSVQSFDADFTGTTAGHTVQIAGSNPTANQAVNIAWVAIVPFANRTLTEGLELYELSADPGDPPEGHSVIWQSDGTGSGDDGDIMIKITAGASTKTGTIVDFSAL